MTQIGNPIQAGRLAQSRQSSTNVDSSNTCSQIWAGNRIVGEVRGDVFYKRVKGSRHFLRKPPSIAFDVASLEDARASGAKTVHIIDEESGKVYRASIPTILSNGFRFNRGRGDQIGLRFVYWQLGDDPLATQLSFGGEL